MCPLIQNVESAVISGRATQSCRQVYTLQQSLHAAQTPYVGRHAVLQAIGTGLRLAGQADVYYMYMHTRSTQIFPARVRTRLHHSLACRQTQCNDIVRHCTVVTVNLAVVPVLACDRLACIEMKHLNENL